MAVEITIIHNAKPFGERVARIRAKQLPFATAQALNATAFDVRAHIIKVTWPDAFTVRNRGFPRAAFRVLKATKRKLVASVFDRLGREYLQLHAKGGTKRAKSGRLAIPSRRVKRSASGRIAAGQRPRAVLSRTDGFIGVATRSTEAIWRQSRDGLLLMFNLQPTVHIDKRFRFFEDGKKIARMRFPGNFRKAFAKALRTAR